MTHNLHLLWKLSVLWFDVNRLCQLHYNSGSCCCYSATLCMLWARGWLLIRHLRSLNGLKFALFYHLEYIWRSFFKTRNSRTLKIHVVFLCTFQFSGVRFTFRIANVSFLSHLFIIIYYLSEYHVHVSYWTIKVHLYVNENLRGHLHDLKLYQIRNIVHFRWRHYDFSKMNGKMENRKKGNYKH